MNSYWWLSTYRMTVYIKVKEGKNIIIESSPIVFKFIGQECFYLKKWLEKQGGLKIYRLKGEQ